MGSFKLTPLTQLRVRCVFQTTQPFASLSPSKRVERRKRVGAEKS